MKLRLKLVEECQVDGLLLLPMSLHQQLGSMNGILCSTSHDKATLVLCTVNNGMKMDQLKDLQHMVQQAN